MGVDHTIEFAVNHGEFTNTSRYTDLYVDRIFAAMDVTTDGSGNPVCRSDLDPTAAYEIDYFAAGNGFADGNFFSDRYYTSSSYCPGLYSGLYCKRITNKWSCFSK